MEILTSNLMVVVILNSGVVVLVAHWHTLTVLMDTLSGLLHMQP